MHEYHYKIIFNVHLIWCVLLSDKMLNNKFKCYTCIKIIWIINYKAADNAEGYKIDNDD